MHRLLAETLLEYETLTGDKVRELVLKGKKPNRPIINDRGGGAKGDTSIFKKEAKTKSPVDLGTKLGNRKDRTDNF